jgi:choline dehydrogenase-like flavoprotein
VIDASVMPLHVCANTVATVYAIAEKGSDLVKEDWNIICYPRRAYSPVESILMTQYGRSTSE